MVQEWQCNACEKGCKRYTNDVPVFHNRQCPDNDDSNLIAHFIRINRDDISEETYLEALKIYLEFAYPDGKEVWRTFFGKRTPTNDIGGNLRRESVYRNASEEPSRSFFFRHGIPSSITFTLLSATIELIIEQIFDINFASSKTISKVILLPHFSDFDILNM